MDDFDQLFPDLRSIELGSNKIAKWSSLQIFKNLKKLGHLSVMYNPVKGVKYEGGFE